MNIPKPTVGQRVLVGYADLHREPCFAEGDVIKVGRKYFLVLLDDAKAWAKDAATREYYAKQFVLETWKGGERVCFDCFADKAHHAQIMDGLRQASERSKLLEQVSKLFQWHSRPAFTLDQLRRIKAITEEGPNLSAHSATVLAVAE